MSKPNDVDGRIVVTTPKRMDAIDADQLGEQVVLDVAGLYWQNLCSKLYIVEGS